MLKVKGVSTLARMSDNANLRTSSDLVCDRNLTPPFDFTKCCQSLSFWHSYIEVCWQYDHVTDCYIPPPAQRKDQSVSHF